MARRGPQRRIRVSGDTKICNTCNTYKPFNEFQKLNRSPDGMQNTCRVCQNKKTADYRKKTERAYWKNKGIYSVYSITNPEGFVYVGYTSIDPKLRAQRSKAIWKLHRKGFTDFQLPLLFKSFDKYGEENHVLEIDSQFASKKEAWRWERFMIMFYKKLGISLNVRN